MKVFVQVLVNDCSKSDLIGVQQHKGAGVLRTVDALAVHLTLMHCSQEIMLLK